MKSNNGVIMKKKVLFIGAHADDIELGCGGTLAKYLEEGYEIKMVVFSKNKNLWPEQKNEFYNAVKILGVSNVEDYEMEACWREFQEKRQFIYDVLEKNREEFRPNIVFVHSTFDTGQDHQTVNQEAKRVFKKTSSIYGYEFPNNNLEFRYDLFIRLEERHIAKKVEALKCYESQTPNRLKAHNYMDGNYLKALAHVRGQQVFSEYAECFEVIRQII